MRTMIRASETLIYSHGLCTRLLYRRSGASREGKKDNLAQRRQSTQRMKKPRTKLSELCVLGAIQLFSRLAPLLHEGGAGTALVKPCFPRLVICVLLFGAPALSAHAAWDLPALAQALRDSPPARQQYEETYLLSALNQPMTSRGELYLSADGVFVKQQTQPARERFEVDEHQARVYRDGELARAIPLDQTPALKAMLGTLRHILMGNLAALDEAFEVNLSGEAEQWTLRLLPRAGVLRERLQRLELSGAQGRILRIETHERSGDRTVTELGE